MSTKELKPRPPALPESTEALLAQRKLRSNRSLNDQIEELCVQLYEYDGYAKYLDAVFDQHAVEGSVAIDRAKAAEMVRERAKKNSNPQIANLNLADIVRSQNIFLRRYGLGRKERKLLAITGGK